MLYKHLGIAPPDPESDVGKFRLLYGDGEAKLITDDPEYEGYGEYTELSDAEIETFITQGNGSVKRGIGFYYLALSGQAAKVAKTVKDYDLQVSTVQRAKDLREAANLWFEQADHEDGLAGGWDIYESFPTTGKKGVIPEGTIPIYGRTYTWEQI